jgi:hypothetical protein
MLVFEICIFLLFLNGWVEAGRGTPCVDASAGFTQNEKETHHIMPD